MTIQPAIFILLFTTFASATNTTEHVGFVSEPNCGRGTIGIIWKCLSAIFLCVYTVLHFDIPPYKRSVLADFGYKLKWSSVMLLAPEYFCTRAICQWYSARKLRSLAYRKQGVAISLTQAYYLVMGGLRVRAKHTNSPSGYYHLNIEHLLHALEDTSIDLTFLLIYLPNDSEFEDRCKADTFAKTLACAQALWVAAMLIGRLDEGLEITLLEVATAGYLFSAFVTYGFWFSKPYGISLTKFLDVDANANKECCTWRSKPSRNPEGDLDISSVLTPVAFVSSTLILAVFHCAAWNYDFPTTVEARLWQTSAILTFAFLPMTAFATSTVNYRIDARAEKLVGQITAVTWALYLAGRIYILIEVFISLRSAPTGIYTSLQWPNYIAHIGS